MEIHRLKPMKEGYPEKLFNGLYKETKQLRKSLAHGIDHRRFGVTKDIIESWFDDKFLFVFDKYHEDMDPDRLKGFIINSLQTFKYRILRGAYTKKSEFYTSTTELDGETKIINYIPDDSFETKEETYGDIINFFKENLTDNAFLLFNLILYPPPYILNRIKKSTSNIPLDLILEYFDLDDTSANVRFIKSLKKEIEQTKEKARMEFNPTLASLNK